MSAFDYPGISASALEILRKFGAAQTVRTTTAGTYDPATDTTSGATTTDHSVIGVLLSYRTADIDGTLIKSGDMRFLFSASGLSFVPDPTCVVIVNSYVWHVQNVRRIEPSGVGVLYDLQVRK